MKILIAFTSSQSYILIKGQIRYLTNNGFEVVVVSSDDKDVEAAVESEGGRYISFNLSREISFFGDLVAVFKAVKLLKKVKPDVINASTPKAGLIFVMAAFILRHSKIIFTLRGLRSDTLTGLKRHIVKASEYLTCNLAKKVIVISPSLREHAISIGVLKRNKSLVFGYGSSNGIDVDRFTVNKSNIAEADGLRNSIGVNKETLIFGFIGRIVRDKGIQEIYQAFKSLCAKYDNIHLVITGSFDEADSINNVLMEEIKNNKFVTLLPHSSKIENIICLYDVLILYSYREGFGNVVLEASSMRKPVIVSDIPGARDTIEPNKTGFLVDPRNSTKLASTMEKYILEPELRFVHGNAGRERVESNFRNNYIWEQQKDFYKNI